MDEIRFEWNPRKARINQRKHGITFEEAKTVFFDEYALLLDDPDHSDVEDRFLLLGLSSASRMVVVIHCVRQQGEVIRIIGARGAGKKEEKQYWERLTK